jgi:hypothetical protein
MNSEDARLVLLEHQIGQTIPGFEVRWKDKGKGSGWQKFIGKIMVFNRGYMKNFISTFYPYVYWPDEKGYRDNPRGSFKVLAHEYVHLWDASLDGKKQTKGWFSFSYIMPHWVVLLSLFALLSIWFSNWWLMSLVALVCALPLPAYWRMKWEYRGYTMSMAVNAWKHGDVKDSTIDRLVSHFTSGEYYFMWPFKRAMKRRLEGAVQKIHSGDVMTWGDPFKHVKVINDLSDKDAIAGAKRIQK